MHNRDDDEAANALQAWFAEDVPAIEDQGFVKEVHRQVARRQRQRRWQFTLVTCTGLIAAGVLFALLGLPAAVLMPLVDLPPGLFAQILQPMNSVGGLLACLVLLMFRLIRSP